MAAAIARCMVLVMLSPMMTAAQNIKGPPQINRDEAQNIVVVKVGEPVRLVCPVSSGSHLIVDWTKDGEQVDERRPGFRFGARNLRVKAATGDLSGTYVCKGITGFGAVQHEIKLVVIGGSRTSVSSAAARRSSGDPTDEQFQDSSLPDGNEYPSLGSADITVSAPKITKTFPARSTIRKMAGSSVRFKCVTSGVPRPSITWYKDDAQMFGSGAVDTSVRGQVTISRVSRSHAGTYECRASSLLGDDVARFQLHVEDPYESRPEIVGDHPRNASVSAGNAVSLQCEVHGRAPMHVKWLKLISPLEAGALQNESHAIQVVNGDRYHVLNSSRTVRSQPDRYRVTLTLPSVAPADAGQYVCLGANNGGFTVRPAYVSVAPLHMYPVGGQSKSHVYLMIIAPVAVVVVLAAVAICCLCRRHKLPQAQNETKSDAEAALMGARIAEQMGNEKRVPNGNAPEICRNAGVPPSCSSTSGHGRRYDPLPPHPTPTASDYAYMLAPVGTRSDASRSQSSSAPSCCSCPPAEQLRPAPPATTPPAGHYGHHHHKHLHYVC